MRRRVRAFVRCLSAVLHLVDLHLLALDRIAAAYLGYRPLSCVLADWLGEVGRAYRSRASHPRPPVRFTRRDDV
ncbi:hypothetical protein [Allonocardiopsis opalescens]|uniref:Uncharacterized protein n=1 Tax=Allonocardiopsis opalescens TaxID=1144618 RepID=A0A2T0Q9D8_9ACTN|nr:hypothetical protein [Allonocardiopsis opalescens]PRY00420.1 hypothetical protein CLV72_10249 [Allonocardiopsis opalescens]